MAFALSRSVVEVKKISPAAPHHRKVSATHPPLRLKTQPKSHSPTAFAATSSSFHHSPTPSLTHSLTPSKIFRKEFSFLGNLKKLLNIRKQNAIISSRAGICPHRFENIHPTNGVGSSQTPCYTILVWRLKTGVFKPKSRNTCTTVEPLDETR